MPKLSPVAWILALLLLPACQAPTVPPPPTLAPPAPASVIPSVTSAPPSPSPVPSTSTPATIADIEPFPITLHLRGVPEVTLNLGRSTFDDAVALVPTTPAGTEGGPRPANLQIEIGDQTLAPVEVFNAADASYILYFDDQGILVLLVDGEVFFERRSMEEVTQAYPSLQTTHDEPNWSEMQTRLTDCVMLIAVFGPSRKLDSLGYAFTCPSS